MAQFGHNNNSSSSTMTTTAASNANNDASGMNATGHQVRTQTRARKNVTKVTGQLESQSA